MLAITMRSIVQAFVVSLALFTTVESHSHGNGHHRHLGEEGGEAWDCPMVATDEDRDKVLQVERKWQPSLLRQDFPKVTIETYIHVIQKEDGTGAIPEQSINETFAHLVKAFEETSFTFELAGINNPVVNNSWYEAGQWSRVSQEMVTALRVGNEATLNIYFTGMVPSLLGYAVFPWWYADVPLFDGAYVGSNYYTGGNTFPYDEGDTVVHEVGHWLGLFHVFLDASPIASLIPGHRALYCLLGEDNDLVADTPKAYSRTSGCNPRKNTCRLRRGRDPIYNYMDYSYDYCMTEFTPGQNARMQTMWLEYRASGQA